VFSRDRSEPGRHLPGAFEQDPRRAATGILGVGTLACPECDAPVAIGSQPLSPRVELSCPFCAHRAPLREFLSLAPPTRPTRVVVRITAPSGRPRLRISPAD
jgi:hypothetical protein